MSQNDFNIANQTFPNTRVDLNGAFQALASMSGGASEPSTTYAGQLWHDTTNDLFKIRNKANSAWITVAKFDISNDRWEIRSNIIQASSTAGITLKNAAGTAILTIGNTGDVTFTGSVNGIPASTTAQGTVERSTSAENIAGSSDVVYPTVLGVRQAFNAAGAAPVFACRAWLYMIISGSNIITILGSGNINSVVRNSEGNFTVTFNTAMATGNYAVIAACQEPHTVGVSVKTTTNVIVTTRNNAGTLVDSGFNLAIFE